jgi:adenylate kinase
LLVGHLAPYVISPKNVELAIVLRKSPYKLQFTYKKRKYTSKKSLENLGSEILGITYYDAIQKFDQEKTFQIDTSDKSISSTVKKVESIFKGTKVRDDKVDWLQLVLKKGDMKKFFPY